MRILEEKKKTKRKREREELLYVILGEEKEEEEEEEEEEERIIRNVCAYAKGRLKKFEMLMLMEMEEKLKMELP